MYPGLVELFFCTRKNQVEHQAKHVNRGSNLKSQNPRACPLQNKTADKPIHRIKTLLFYVGINI